MSKFKKGIIYRIQNTENGKYYIGSTRNFEERKRRHIRELQENSHHNYKLQADYNQYGLDVFVFQVVKTIDYIGSIGLVEIETSYICSGNSKKMYNIEKSPLLSACKKYIKVSHKKVKKKRNKNGKVSKKNKKPAYEIPYKHQPKKKPQPKNPEKLGFPIDKLKKKAASSGHAKLDAELRQRINRED